MAGISRIAQSKRNALSAFAQVKRKLDTADDLTSLIGTVVELNAAAEGQRGSYKSNRQARESIQQTEKVSEEVFKLLLVLAKHFDKYEPNARLSIIDSLEAAVFNVDYVDEAVQLRARLSLKEAWTVAYAANFS